MPQHDKHPAGRRAELLRLLRDAGEPMGIAEIADRLQVHPNTVRFHLETLVSNGQVERTTADPGTPGRPPQLFQTVRGMDPMGPRHYRVLAEVLAASLATDPDPGRRAVEAGRSWGRQQASGVAGAIEGDKPIEAAESVERLMGLLDELAFAPEQATGGGRPRIRLRHCPFLELAVRRADVVCPIHLGLMQGALESWRAPVTVDRLDAFVEPDLCIADLTVVGPS